MWKPAFMKRKGASNPVSRNQGVLPLAQSLDDLAHWFDSPLGSAILEAEREVLDEELGFLFGYHLMQLGVAPHYRLTNSSRVGHCFSLAPKMAVPVKAQESLCDVQALAELDTLPLADDSIDVTILHHVLEFSPNPQQVLKEAARVTVPRGHIIIMGFNPFSLLGMMQPLARITSSAPVWRRRQLRTARVKDWLEFLDFSCVKSRQMSHNLPINNPRYLRVSNALDRLLRGSKIPFGSIYFLLARKDKTHLTPIKPEWQSSRFLRPAHIPKRAVSARREQSASILPMRIKRPRN